MLSAAFVAGALNAAAGGGTFLTLPALIFVGVPPVAANASGTVALLPGYVTSAWGFREDLRGRRGVSLGTITAASLLGGGLGAVLLLATPGTTFRAIVPWLMLLATIWFALGPWAVARFGAGAPAGIRASLAGILAMSVYGGYFNGGVGIMLLALFGLLGYTDLNYMNGLKNLVSAALTAIAVVIYSLGGAVVWNDALLMMAAAATGGYLGARGARRVPAHYLRYGIVAVGALMTAVFFLNP